MLHESKQNPLQKPFVSLLQRVLRTTDVGSSFFKAVADPKAIKNILEVAYAGPVDDDTVEL
jgi:hypothetical protein